MKLVQDPDEDFLSVYLVEFWNKKVESFFKKP